MERCQEEAKLKREEKKRKKRRRRRGQKQMMENEVMSEILTGVPRQTDSAGCGVTRKAVSVAQSTNAGGDPFSNSGLRVGRKDWPKGAASGLD